MSFFVVKFTEKNFMLIKIRVIMVIITIATLINKIRRSIIIWILILIISIIWCYIIIIEFIISIYFPFYRKIL